MLVLCLGTLRTHAKNAYANAMHSHEAGMIPVPTALPSKLLLDPTYRATGGSGLVDFWAGREGGQRADYTVARICGYITRICVYSVVHLLIISLTIFAQASNWVSCHSLFPPIPAQSGTATGQGVGQGVV